MENIKEIYRYIPYIFSISIILNILGNIIKYTFNINSKYIVWILLIISIIINFIVYKINYESFFLAFLSLSFAISMYDIVKNSKRIATRR